jgi:hypothetical protein
MDLINANGTKSIIDTRVKVNMTIGQQEHNHKEQISFFVGDIGTHDILLGTDWLIKHNPTIDWNKYTLTMNRCPHTCYCSMDQAGAIAELLTERAGVSW